MNERRNYKEREIAKTLSQYQKIIGNEEKKRK